MKRHNRFISLVAPAALAAGLGLSACASDNPTEHSTSITAPSQTDGAPSSAVPSKTPDLDASPAAPSEEKMADMYANSLIRNEMITAAVVDATRRILDDVQAGGSNFGPTDFYNYDTNTWNSKSGIQQGQGYFQHTPDYGGGNSLWSIEMLQLPDGSFDTSNIKSIHFAPNADSSGPNSEQPSVEFRCIVSDDGSCVWETSVGNGVVNGAIARGTIFGPYNIDGLSVEEGNELDGKAKVLLDLYTQPS